MTTQNANKLGREAFHAGKMRVPSWDAALISDPSHREPLGTGGKQSKALMTAWLSGWDAECMASMKAPIPADFG